LFKQELPMTFWSHSLEGEIAAPGSVPVSPLTSSDEETWISLGDAAEAVITAAAIARLRFIHSVMADWPIP
jgi:hypothetical protein